MKEQSIDPRRIENTLTALAQITATPGQGVTRLPFTPELRAAAALLTKQMREAGLSVTTDASGAVLGRLRGRSGRTVVIASHYDSVCHGGAFDGIAGVVCGIEAARQIGRDGIPEDDLLIAATNDEEGARFGAGFFSTKAFLGAHTVQSLRETRDVRGVSQWDAMAQYGLPPEKLGEAKWDLSRVKAFLELHIEQGPVLEQVGVPVGVVTGIVGMRRRRIVIHGVAGHAGTVPMNQRCDALAAAAAVIAAVPVAARCFPGAVATVGQFAATPNEVNTIAEQAVFSLDIRSLDERAVCAIDETVLRHVRENCSACGASFETAVTLEQAPVHMDAQLQKILTACAAARGYASLALHSGAGHDSLVMAPHVPTAMLFVPSRGGRSHCPEEFTDCADLARAAEVLTDAVQQLMKENRQERVS